MNYNIIYRDNRGSLIDVKRNDKKLKESILIDIHTVTVAYLEQKLNQGINCQLIHWEGNGIYPN